MLVDAAIEVLAAQGARGLTFRAVDSAAAVPPGTTSNYFTSRDDLLAQAAARVYERFQPDENTIASHLAGTQDREKFAALMRETVHRVVDFRPAYLALLELRLEATRRPEIRAVLTRDVRDDIAALSAAHQASGLPGDAASVRLLHLVLSWLIVERLTLPDVYSEQEADELVARAVERLIRPAPPGDPDQPDRALADESAADADDQRPGGFVHSEMVRQLSERRTDQRAAAGDESG